MRHEYFARTAIIIFFLLFIGALVWGYAQTGQQLVLTGNMPEAGGWQPGVISAQAGEPLRLKLTSNDVVHGFAIGKIEGTQVEVNPGKFTEMTVTIDEPGTYTYYCTRWCGPNHWRMRGTIEVEGDEPLVDEDAEQPLYLQLGIDIDALHEAANYPSTRPSAASSPALYRLLPEQYLQPETYFTYSPEDIFNQLKQEASLSNLEDEKIWELVAGLYWHNTDKDELALGERLYAKNCAACHGLNGQGDGVFAKAEEHLETPTDFSDPKVMLSASSALLHGKIIRGGMGTGMPYWGTIFTENETWALANYLWSFQFEYKH